MLVTVSLNDVLRDEQHNERVINFTSALLRIVSNIPNFILSLFILPFYLLMLPIVHALLSIAIRKITVVAKNVHEDVKRMDYQTVRKVYDLVSHNTRNFTKSPENPSFLTKGIRHKLEALMGLYKSIQNSLESILFVDVSNQPSLTEQEKKDFELLNDAWGDDEDGKYGEMTFNQLKHR